jgi:hypothetical protein
MTHLALRLTRRSEARITSMTHALRLEVRSKDHTASCFTSNSEVRSMTHLALRLTARSEARKIYMLPLSGRVLSDYTKLILKVFKLYTR